MSKEEIQQIIQSNLLKDQFKSFQDFINHHTNPQFLSVCQKSWNFRCLIVTCNTCSYNSNSCYCLGCFLKGNHQNHSITIRFGSHGNCDCGDSQLIQHSGFCHLHSGSSHDPDQDQLTKETISLVQTFSKHLSSKIDNSNFRYIFSIFSQLISAGDGMRRSVVIGISDYIYQSMTTITQQNNPKFLESLIALFGQLINDKYFRKVVSKSIFLNCNEFVQFLSTSDKTSLLQQLSDFVFQVFFFRKYFRIFQRRKY